MSRIDITPHCRLCNRPLNPDHICRSYSIVGAGDEDDSIDVYPALPRRASGGAFLPLVVAMLAAIAALVAVLYFA